MRNLAPGALFSLAVGYVLAQFLVLFYNNWYFAGYFWLKTALLTPLVALGFGVLLLTGYKRLSAWLGAYWLFSYLVAMLTAKGPDLRALSFTSVLDFEAAMVWVPLGVIAAWAICRAWQRARQVQAERRRQNSQLALRRKLRDSRGTQAGTRALLATAGLLLLGLPQAARAENPEPRHVFTNRHEEFTDKAKRLTPAMPGLPGIYPTPAHLRAREVFRIVIENRRDGAIYVVPDKSAAARAGVEPDTRIDLGHVLAAVSQVNPKGFTASGWAEPGTVCASAVNAIHIKTDHDYAGGHGVIFSLVPVEFADFNPSAYKSYFNQSSSLFTDIKAGTGIFGGSWAPLAGSRLMFAPGGDIAQAAQAQPGYVPKDGDTLVIEVARLAYNPEWIEFENSFGGLIWVKEIGMDPYPVGQVLKPVAGVGRFLGTQYADLGRIRASHPGVLCISTTPLGTIGGFQIIPRDHAMSSEMTNARVKTQWMVVGPLWALDPSWEGLPPLFTDYFYPAFTPAFNPDGSVNEDAHGASVFLDRFTVRGRYSDSEDPAEYVLLKPTASLDNYALKTLTNIRIYFPRG